MALRRGNSDMNQEYYLKEIASKQDKCINILNEGVKQREEYLKKIKLDAANEVRARDLQIKRVASATTRESKKARNSAIATGVFTIGLIGATLYSGLDVSTVINNGIQALKSVESLGEFCLMIPSAIYATLAGTIVNLTSFIKHRNKFDEVSQQYCDLYNSDPSKYLSGIEKNYCSNSEEVKSDISKKNKDLKLSKKKRK